MPWSTVSAPADKRRKILNERQHESVLPVELENVIVHVHTIDQTVECRRLQICVFVRMCEQANGSGFLYLTWPASNKHSSTQSTSNNRKLRGLYNNNHHHSLASFHNGSTANVALVHEAHTRAHIFRCPQNQRTISPCFYYNRMEVVVFSIPTFHRLFENECVIYHIVDWD